MKHSTDILFVIPGDRVATHQGLAKKVPVSEPPAFTILHAEYLRQKNIGVDILDMSVSDLTVNEVGQQVDEINPTMIVMVVYGTQPSASTQNMPAARVVSGIIKNHRPDMPIMITGTHPAALPEQTLLAEPVDMVCTGEGPVTFYEAISALKSGSKDELKKARGLLLKNEDGSLLRTPPAPFVQNLDLEMPIGAWDMVSVQDYYAHDWHTNYAPKEDRRGYASLITSFGCPFKCPFCCIQAPFREGEGLLGLLPSKPNSYRLRNPQLVIKEIEFLVENYGIRHFKIHDEMFVLHLRHVLEICAGIEERFGDSLNIWAYSRIDTAKEGLLEPMRRAGITWLGLGVEAADSKVRDGQDKSFTDDKIFEVVKAIDAAGINPGCNYIFGLEDDTPETMQATLDMAIAINSPYANFYCAMPYPGSELYAVAKTNGWALPEDGGDSWIAYSQHSYETRPVGNARLSPSEVLRFRDQAWGIYHERAGYLEALGHRSGFGEPAVEHIKDLLSMPPLCRKILGDLPPE